MTGLSPVSYTHLRAHDIANYEFGKEEFAAAMNVSSSLLYKRIKALTDQSPSDFIKTVRMNHALKLLQSGQYTVTAVSYTHLTLPTNREV